MQVLYLDTGHLSRLARFPDESDCRAVVELLDPDRVCIGLTFLHIQELSDPRFKSRRQVGVLLDQMPIVWAPGPDIIFDREIRSGIQRALTGSAEPVVIFDAGFARALGAPAEANIPVSAMLEVMAERPDLRTHLYEAADYGAAADNAMKRIAAVVRAPKEPILAHIRDLNTAKTAAGLQPMSPEEIFARAGGMSAFPALNAAHSLARTRLNDELFSATRNDMFDEWHASYAPYCAAMALDRGTTARFRMTRLSEAKRVTHRLAEIPALLDTG